MNTQEKAGQIAQAIQEQICDGGTITLDEVFESIISGSIFSLRAFTMLFNMEGATKEDDTQEAIMWKVVDSILENLSPQDKMPEMMKWYIMRYEEHARLNWTLTEMLLDKVKELGGKSPFEQMAADSKFVEAYNKALEMEKRINARLRQDGLTFQVSQIWSDVFKEEEKCQ